MSDLRNNVEQNLSPSNHSNSKGRNIQIYDNDDAYMLNFDRDNGDENEALQDVSDLDNLEKLKDKKTKDKSNLNFSEEIDDQEPRKEFIKDNSRNIKENFNNKGKRLF